MVLLEFAMAPRGHEQSLSADVARIVDIIDRSGLPYQLTAMGTLLEGGGTIFTNVLALGN